MKAYERFLQYVKVHTASDPESSAVPSSERQKDLARILVQEMRDMGIADAFMDDKGYVYGHIPASGCKNDKRLGFIAHMDTSPDYHGENVNPVLHADYDGCDLEIGCGKVLSVKTFPHLPSLAGRTLITADGTTLLGCDDKAGIAEILTMCEEVLTKNLPHPALSIAFTPDEEIGSSADSFDLDAFAADFAYTVDGGEENEIVFENFNAAGAEFVVHGVNIHPGSAKDTMLNASLVAMEINSLLPGCDTPAKTEMYEGFYHLIGMSGNVEEAKVSYIIRDHDAGMFAARLATLCHIEKTLNEKYGDGTVVLTIAEQYRNMAEVIEQHYHLVDNADAVIRSLGMEPSHSPIRGGTDGARLSFMGLPCPNLGTGGYAFHGPYEHVTVEGMDTAVKVICGIVAKYAE
ncbi:MAG: peptidase T [Ruminococcaceae bacterium]|nr:peptidase T [Oscillospiraceae bacterium]